MNYGNGLNPDELFQWKDLPGLPDTNQETLNLLWNLGELAGTAERLATKIHGLASIVKREGFPEHIAEDLSYVLSGIDEAAAKAMRQCRILQTTRPVFYAGEDTLYINCRSADEAMNAILDEWPDFDYPEEIRILQYAPRFVIRSNDAILDLFLDNLNEDESGEDHRTGLEPENIQRRLEAAEQKFIESVLLKYQSYYVEPIRQADVRVRSWMWFHRPDLLRNFSSIRAICHHCRRLAGRETMRTCRQCLRRGCARCWLGKEPATGNWRRCQRKLAEATQKEQE